MSESSEKVIIFSLNDIRYGVWVTQVLSIEKMQEMTRVPNAPDFVVGVMNLRGIIVPVIDLKQQFNMEQAEPTRHTRIMIVNVGEVMAGLIVDEAREVLDINPETVDATPDIAGGLELEYISGVAKKGDDLLVLLNLSKVLNKEEAEALKEIKAT
ncbi:chemotaxis protein CheW [Tuberibacillus sp. Marseille-P3662]|uniref:chemotaxis protein CheW n=1 Tax=Tuberibacillus sp. Marseille-P3662 TaxID=1965358 RepID=UPI000A1CCC1A|nr:chemotaxis protein CheW [Tuberibacillus sp. Marseille-P3662]